MLQEHPLTSKILRVHTALFSVAGACIMVLVWPQKPLGQTAFCRVVNAVGTIAIFALIAVGFMPGNARHVFSLNPLPEFAILYTGNAARRGRKGTYLR